MVKRTADLKGFEGQNDYIEILLKDPFLGKICSEEEADRNLSPLNHGESFDIIYNRIVEFDKKRLVV
ncbi:MAG: hypothetical protein FWG90_05715 [Oscillospiraceae bacterium]|nr:hypothetical protein [Oscillospiraceae bacterium]